MAFLGTKFAPEMVCPTTLPVEESGQLKDHQLGPFLEDPEVQRWACLLQGVQAGSLEPMKMSTRCATRHPTKDPGRRMRPTGLP